jgi:cation diffusion facilitator family transporter
MNDQTPDATRLGVQRITLIGVAVNIVLSCIKFTVGIVGHSQAVTADAVHSLSDLTTDVAILLGVRYWSAPADEAHPYGHGRIESLVSSFIGMVLMLVAFGIGKNAVMTIRDPQGPPPGLIAFVGAVLSIVSKELLYRWTLRSGRHLKSSAVVANAWHHRSDALSSVPVAVAVVVAALNPRLSMLDHIGALLVCVMILHAAWKIVRPAFDELTDRRASRTSMLSIEAIIRETPGVRAVHGIRTRRIGAGIQADVHVLVDESMTVRQGHDISEVVKQRLLQRGPDVLDVVVHLEPYDEPAA